MTDNEISIVIGSWGSYNECNERALGSKWICLNDYEEWSEILACCYTIDSSISDESFLIPKGQYRLTLIGGSIFILPKGGYYGES